MLKQSENESVTVDTEDDEFVGGLVDGRAEWAKILSPETGE